MASYVAAYRIGMLASTVGVLYLVAAFETVRLRHHGAAWTLGYLGMAVLVLIGIVTTIVATEPEQSAVAEAAHAGEKNSVMRVAQAAYHAFADFLTRDAAIVVLLFVVLYKFCDAFAGAMTAAFVIKIGFSRRRLRQHRQGRRPRRHPDRRLRRRRAGGALQHGDLPVGRRASLQMVVEPRLHLARAGRHQPLGAGGRDHRGELHRRDRHRDLRRLPLGAVPEPAAHRDAVRLADGAGRGRTHLSLGRRRLSSRRRPAGRCSSWSASLVAIPSLLLLAWLQQRGHFAELGPARVVRADD